MCIDCNDAVFYWGFVFGGLFLRLLFFAVVFFAVVVVETWHAASLPDGTGTEQGRNRDGTGRNRNRNRGRGRGRAARGTVVEMICKSERWKRA